jgi:hypothetical protein
VACTFALAVESPIDGEEANEMAPALTRSVSSIATSARALQLRKAEKALLEKQRSQNGLIWMALGAIIVSGTATGYFLLEKIINYFKKQKKTGDSASDREDEGVSDQIIEDDALAEGIIGLARKRKRSVANDEDLKVEKVVHGLSSQEFLQFLDRFDIKVSLPLASLFYGRSLSCNNTAMLE